MVLDISKMLTPSKAPFYGIIPGNAATPLGYTTPSKVRLVTLFYSKININFNDIYLYMQLPLDFARTLHGD
jgi:hypothetical protein